MAFPMIIRCGEAIFSMWMSPSFTRDGMVIAAACLSWEIGAALPSQTQKLITITHDALMRAIDTVREGSYLGDIGSAIQSLVEAEGFSVVREFCGHGLGRVFHDAPQVVHFGKHGTGLRLQEGMFFTIEPMINVGAPAVTILKDGWTAITRDRSLSAQFEHSIGVTSHGAEIFTASAKGWHQPPYTQS